MPIVAKIMSITRVGDGISVGVGFSDGSSWNTDFTPIPTAVDIRTTVKAEVNKRNQLETQINRLQTLIGVEID